jgi:hypothetical protein
MAAANNYSPAATPTIRPRGLAESQQNEANRTKYSFCFHIPRSRQPLVAAIARPRDYQILLKMHCSHPPSKLNFGYSRTGASKQRLAARKKEGKNSGLALHI